MAKDKKATDDAVVDSNAKIVKHNDKKWVHPHYYHGVTVVDINGHEFTINAAVPGPIRVETSHLSHPAYNPDKKIEKVSKGRAEQYQERLRKMEQMKK